MAAQTTAEKGEQQGIEDIVVTATRQSVGSQHVPISLTAVGEKQLQSEGITSPSQLNQLAPGLFVLSSSSEGIPRFTLRGLTFTDTTTTASPAVATYIDDVYQAFQQGISTNIFDLQRVEVLRGPQGTTFGRNTTGGAIAYYSQTPKNIFEGYVTGRVAGGDQAQRFIEGVINVPIIDNVLALRVSGHIENKSDFIFDETLGRKRGGSSSGTGRIQLKYTPDEDTTVNLIVGALQRRGDPALFRAYFPTGDFFGTPAGPTQLRPNRLALPIGQDLYDNFDNYTVTLRADRDLGAFALTSITHFRDTHWRQGTDLSGVGTPNEPPSPIFPPFYQKTDVKAYQYGQELRLSSDPTRSVSGILGAYYERDVIKDVVNYANIIQPAPLSYNNLFRGRTTTMTYAVFGNLTVKLNDQLAVIGGIRQTFERKVGAVTPLYFIDGNFDWTQGNMTFDGAPPVAPSAGVGPYRLTQKSKPLTWDATINFTPATDKLLFIRVARGFRSGGFNPAPVARITPLNLIPGNGAVAPNAPPVPFNGETVQSYEGGFKLGFFNGKLRVNGGIYHYDYSDQQVTSYPGGQVTIQNVGKSVVDGGELEVNVAAAHNLDLRASVAYTDARYKVFTDSQTVPGVVLDYGGNTLQQSPKWQFNGGLNYSLPLSETYNASLNATASYRSRVYFDNANDPLFSSGPKTYINLRLGAEPTNEKGFSVYAFVNNLLNVKALASGVVFIPGTYYLGLSEVGRLIGVDAKYRF